MLGMWRLHGPERGGCLSQKGLREFCAKTDLEVRRRHALCIVTHCSGNITDCAPASNAMRFLWIELTSSSLYHKDRKQTNSTLSILPHGVLAGAYRIIIAWWRKLENGRLSPCFMRCFWSTGIKSTAYNSPNNAVHRINIRQSAMWKNCLWQIILTILLTLHRIWRIRRVEKFLARLW